MNTIDLMACVDCGFFVAYGEVEQPDPTWRAANFERGTAGLVVVNGDSDRDHEFSWSPCDCCGSRLGGTRMHCVAWEKPTPPALPTFTMFCDPGHAWLRVTGADLAALGLSPADFSRYSYRDSRGNYYLEEDCDASKFVATFEARHGAVPTIADKSCRPNYIRSMPRIHD